MSNPKKPKAVNVTAGSTVKYLVKAGMVTSKSDGQEHFISARELMRLYRVPSCECAIYKEQGQSPEWQKNLILLSPDYHGDYTIPSK